MGHFLHYAVTCLYSVKEALWPIYSTVLHHVLIPLKRHCGPLTTLRCSITDRVSKIPRLFHCVLHQTCAGCVCAGSSEDSYILHMVHDAVLLGYRSVGLNTLTRSYSMINALKCTVFNYNTKISISWCVM